MCQSQILKKLLDFFNAKKAHLNVPSCETDPCCKISDCGGLVR